jgi:nitrous oxide reductase accessory protein NosL
MTLTAIAWLATAACVAQARSPEPIPLDRVQCAHCGMVISTEAGAAQIVTSGEDTRFYDDVGCLIAGGHAGQGTEGVFVRSADGVWTDARTASFARSATAHTAMGSGIVAYATIAAARAADRDGRAWSWDEIRRQAGDKR